MPNQVTASRGAGPTQGSEGADAVSGAQQTVHVAQDFPQPVEHVFDYLAEHENLAGVRCQGPAP